ncbi:MAG TPA: hypothetical protein VF406_12640 [Thermodesulfobacteriota bacterium]
MRTLGRIAGALASAACLLAGIWLLTKVGFSRGNDALTTAIGVYFVGKGLFVGPMLWIASAQGGDKDRP